MEQYLAREIITVKKRVFGKVLQLAKHKVMEWEKGKVDCRQKGQMSIKTLQCDVFMLNLLLAFRWF